jgi:hypothetical protein
MERERIERMKEEMAQADIEYRKSKKRFFDLRFTNGTIEVVVLSSIEEFLKEGSQLHHCVFVNSYYDRKNSLIMSARIRDKRVATIELSLSRWEIMQCRGIRNQQTKYDNDIMDLIKQNMKAIRRAASARQVA